MKQSVNHLFTSSMKAYRPQTRNNKNKIHGKERDRDLEIGKSFSFNKAIETASCVRFPIHV